MEEIRFRRSSRSRWFLNQAARSNGGSTGAWSSVCRPLTRRMVICPDAISARNSIAAVSALGSAHWVLIRRLNSPYKRSMVLVVRKDFHCRGGQPGRGGGTNIADYGWIWHSKSCNWAASSIDGRDHRLIHTSAAGARSIKGIVSHKRPLALRSISLLTLHGRRARSS